MLALEGRQLGNYDVIRRIRVGGMGAVYEGKQRTAFDRRVAIKVILGNYATDRDMRRRFAREARTIARLHHPHILPLIEYGDEKGILYLVMPFIEGGTLTSYLRRSLPDLNEVSAIYQQLLDAVEYAHDEGLIHRDIKSSNVLMEQRRSGAPYVYLADFGLVRTSRQAQLEQAGRTIPLDQVPGTPHYMAPEQTRGIVTTASDIYALGVLLYQLLTGELPYDDPDEVEVIQMHLSAPVPSPSSHDASIPVELDEVVHIAMAKRMEDRFGSVAELRQAFLAATQGAAVSIEDDLAANEIFLPPGRPISTPLLPPEPLAPTPIAMPLAEPRRLKPVAAPYLVRGKQRITDSVRNNQKVRTTEPVQGRQSRRRRFTLSLVATVLVPILLLVLLIVSRLLGVSLFPVGVPILGADPTAIVTVTPQTRLLHDTYLLTASPQTKNADASTRIIPDRLMLGMASGSSNAQTTGITTIPGVQARGSLLLINSSKLPISVPAGNKFIAISGVQVQTTQSVVVPAKQDGTSGSATVSAVAIDVGTVGNIQANAISTLCCDGLSVSNPFGFSGGVDARQVHVVTQADVNGVSGPLSLSIQKQVLKQLLQKLGPGEVIAELPVYQTVVTSDNPVGTQVNEVGVQVTVSTIVIVYNRNVANQVAIQLLGEQAAQSLGKNYQLQGNAGVDTPRVEVGKNGVIYLSMPVHEVWIYQFSTQQMSQWRKYIRGATQVAALAYLNEQSGVSAVHIHLPFGTDHFPSSIDQIKIELG